jgi:hypothetical protein
MAAGSNPIPSDWPEEAEDAAQFFLYRAQVGAASLQDLLTATEINGMLAAPRSPDTITDRLVAALAEAYRRDCAQAKVEMNMAEALGETRPAPDALWELHREAFLARPEPSPLRLAAERFVPARPGWWASLLGKLRGGA